MSLRDELLALGTSDLAPVPGVKGVFVRSLSAADAIGMDSLRKGITNGFVLWTILCACDEQGNLLFTVADAENISKMPVKVVKSIAMAALDLNGLSNDEIEATKKN